MQVDKRNSDVQPKTIWAETIAENRRLMRFVICFTTIAGFLASSSVSAAGTLLTFEEFDALGGGVEGHPVLDYFAANGVIVTGDRLGVFDVRNFIDRGEEYTKPASRTNFLAGTTSPQVNTWTFLTPMLKVGWVRNGLITTGPGGTTHPEWRATAYDNQGLVLGTVGEELIATFGNIPPTSFELSGQVGRPIKSIQWYSNHHNFAGYGAIILDNVMLTSVPEPGAILVAVLGICGIAMTYQRKRQ